MMNARTKRTVAAAACMAVVIAGAAFDVKTAESRDLEPAVQEIAKVCPATGMYSLQCGVSFYRAGINAKSLQQHEDADCFLRLAQEILCKDAPGKQQTDCDAVKGEYGRYQASPTYRHSLRLCDVPQYEVQRLEMEYQTQMRLDERRIDGIQEYEMLRRLQK